MENKKQKRPPRELFRSWLRNGEGNSSNYALKPRRLIRNVLGPVATAVGNHLIIENILKHVTDSKDLLNCRLVSTCWTPVATARLIQLDKIQCKGFIYHYVPACYRSANGPLSELIECAKGSAKFPATSFTFRAGDMRSKDAKKFLTTMGTSVETLTLHAVDNGSLCGKMNLTDIMRYTPNLQTLIFKGGSYYDVAPTQRLTLSALKSLKLACQFTTEEEIKFILSVATNLKTFDGAWRLNDVEPIHATNKIHTVKRWCPSKFPFESGLIQLATEGKLRLNELVVNIRNSGFTITELWKCYLKLLNESTIQKLILNCSKYPANVSFPLNIGCVKELVLMPMSNPGGSTHFPIGTNLNATFPALDTLSMYDELYAVCCAGSMWDHCFPLSHADEAVGRLPSVTTLNLRAKSVSVRMLRAMKKICPYVQNLELCIHEELDKEQIIHELCGEWRNLKELSINLIFKNDTLVSLDSALTGLKEESLRSLNNDRSLTEQEKLRKAEDTRYVLWIGNISGLVLLNIKYDVPYYVSRPKKMTFIPFTEYSGLYAFNLMTNLKVNLHYHTRQNFVYDNELKTALASISSFATVGGQ